MEVRSGTRTVCVVLQRLSLRATQAITTARRISGRFGWTGLSRTPEQHRQLRQALALQRVSGDVVITGRFQLAASEIRAGQS